jgi:hypothetical protein
MNWKRALVLVVAMVITSGVMFVVVWTLQSTSGAALFFWRWSWCSDSWHQTTFAECGSGTRGCPGS